MVKNADKLYYPVKESILSVLPIVDEFIVALGDCDPGDKTREIIESIASPKIRIIDTVWDTIKYPDGTENAHQTDIAKNQCTGDWLFYVQADEVIHEKYLEIIIDRCRKLLYDKEVEGLLFDYVHFWGDYNHFQNAHNWYRREVRIIRNDPDIHSWLDAQSFRRIPLFDGLQYRRVENTYKLKVAKVNAAVYHYGWVRPPRVMRKKSVIMDSIFHGEEKAGLMNVNKTEDFDYGPLDRVPVFMGSHPAVMKNWINTFDWNELLQYSGLPDKNREAHKHERMKYKVLTWIEQNLLGGNRIGEFKNYRLLNK
ncbi:MAG: hypothetical protein NTW49_01940 [Bacteroidia bacterium]|nr:hypothetical protein [Bacteroidia bacterium]